MELSDERRRGADALDRIGRLDGVIDAVRVELMAEISLEARWQSSDSDRALDSLGDRAMDLEALALGHPVDRDHVTRRAMERARAIRLAAGAIRYAAEVCDAGA